MSDTERCGKAPGFEFWSKRPGKGAYSPNSSKFGKRQTHKAERRQDDPKKRLDD